MPFWPEPPSDICHFLSRSDELYCPFNQLGVDIAKATNSANMRCSEDVIVSPFFFRLNATM